MELEACPGARGAWREGAGAGTGSGTKFEVSGCCPNSGTVDRWLSPIGGAGACIVVGAAAGWTEWGGGEVRSGDIAVGAGWGTDSAVDGFDSGKRVDICISYSARVSLLC